MDADKYVPTYCGPSYTELPMEVRNLAFNYYLRVAINLFLEIDFGIARWFFFCYFIILPTSRDKF